MLHLITGNNVSKSRIIYFVDEFFDENFATSDFTNTDRDILKEIDNAIVVDNNVVKTPFGLCDIRKLSTGTKTLLCILHFTDKVFDVSGCGSNALDILNKIAVSIDISVHTNIRLALTNWYGVISINDTLIPTKLEYRKWWTVYEQSNI